MTVFLREIPWEFTGHLLLLFPASMSMLICEVEAGVSASAIPLLSALLPLSSSSSFVCVGVREIPRENKVPYSGLRNETCCLVMALDVEI